MTATEIIKQFVPNSPFVTALGMELGAMGDGEAEVRLPFREENVTIGDVVHGGAISALCDVTAMASAWAGAPVPDQLRGVTVSLTVNFCDTARAEDLVARGHVVRRGRSLATCAIDVHGTDDRVVATALATYKVG